MRAVARAIVDAELAVDNLGELPTPALTYYAVQQRHPSIMVTGSHIPFDRNGIKFNKSTGEVLKADEPAILQAVSRVRRAQYARDRQESLFGDDGMFKEQQPTSLPRPNSQARRDYLRRYLDFFPENALKGQRIVFYQHSAVGRDLLVELLTTLGVQAIPMGRSESFVPIDTEAISTEQLELLQGFADQAWQRNGPVDAIFSTDGDSDRPLVAGIDAKGKLRFFSGDLLGIVAADFLKADAVVVPISVNDAVDHWAAGRNIAVRKTRIGSPHVIEAMQQVATRGAGRVVGWEANGGFLTATEIERDGRVLKALPTRDAALDSRLITAASSFGETLFQFSRKEQTDGNQPNPGPQGTDAKPGRFCPLQAAGRNARDADQDGRRAEVGQGARADHGPQDFVQATDEVTP